jgi:hypothetical protein
MAKPARAPERSIVRYVSTGAQQRHSQRAGLSVVGQSKKRRR